MLDVCFFVLNACFWFIYLIVLWMLNILRLFKEQFFQVKPKCLRLYRIGNKTGALTTIDEVLK